MNTAIGLDISMTRTGVTVLEEGGRIIASEIVKSKPQGDKPADETRRMLKIVEDVILFADEAMGGASPTLVAIENLAFMAQGTSLTQLAGLHHVIRFILQDALGWPFVLVAPTTLKKYCTGSGKGEKDMMAVNIFKDYGFQGRDNNEFDSYGLAAIGLAVAGTPLKSLTVPQKEVVKLISKQI